MSIWAYSLILSIYQYPKPNLALRVFEMLCYTGLEGAVGFLLQHTKTGEIRWRPVFLVEGGQVESLMPRKGIIGNNLV